MVVGDPSLILDIFYLATSCWLQMNKGVALAEQIPLYVMIIATFTLIEAAGSAEYKALKGDCLVYFFSLTRTLFFRQIEHSTPLLLYYLYREI